MKKILVVCLTLFTGFLFAEDKNRSLEAEAGTPIVISLANKQDGGEWEMIRKPDDLTLENKRKGYLYTYFILKSESELQGPATFIYKSGKVEDERTYFIRILPKKTGENPESSGPIETLSAKERKELVVVSEKSRPASFLKMPENTRLYITNLAEEGLYDQALTEISRLEEKKDSAQDSWWLTQKKIEILDKQQKYGEIAALVNSRLEGQAEGSLDAETEFFLRLSKARADYRAGMKNEALAQMIFLKNYYPDHPMIYYELGKFYFQEKLTAKGITLFEHLASRFQDPPSKDEVYFHLARYYYQVVGLNGYNLSYKYYKKILNSGMTSAYYSEALRMSEFLEKNFINIR